MNRETAKHYLPLVQALSEGKVIQMFDGRDWIDLGSVTLEYPVSRYRIKPEPREIFVPRWPDGFEGAVYKSEREAKQILSNETTCKIIRYREVLE